ncbi:DUF4296 domain-containing protein [Bacteroidales bacterium OttesenSCG-928-K03]|nr:DUF4296 domain-containing protein [Odoribacter sp. OttesenSCG-928-L07]MDL2239442.1 DUF4296 domain-containing protein [Bacteroidales bacterium OttesenSCG-928-L14]MDL2240563.1 DUF4296 domain-containing protein [Bacteroidales bacterium OttesenSCG-928-K22]MDL2242655.1 DUF4296 domain-containing protein [Bacteroidales bacterium OttesenSCG-928-K03]
MKKTFNILLLICIIATCLAGSSCKRNKVPPYVMAKDSVINILVDHHIIEGIIAYENTKKPNTPKYATKYFNCYFEINNIDKARYDTSLVYYYHDAIDIANVVNEDVVNRLSVIEAEIDKLIMTEKKKGDE